MSSVGRLEEKKNPDPTPTSPEFRYVYYLPEPESKSTPILNAAIQTYYNILPQWPGLWGKHDEWRVDSSERPENARSMILQNACCLFHESYAGSKTHIKIFDTLEAANEFASNNPGGMFYKLNHDLKISDSPQAITALSGDSQSLNVIDLLISHIDWMKSPTADFYLMNDKYQWRTLLEPKTWSSMTRAAELTLQVAKEYLRLHPARHEKGVLMFKTIFDEQNPAGKLQSIAEKFLQAKPTTVTEMRQVYLDFSVGLLETLIMDLSTNKIEEIKDIRGTTLAKELMRQVMPTFYDNAMPKNVGELKKYLEISSLPKSPLPPNP